MQMGNPAKGLVVPEKAQNEFNTCDPPDMDQTTDVFVAIPPKAGKAR